MNRHAAAAAAPPIEAPTWSMNAARTNHVMSRTVLTTVCGLSWLFMQRMNKVTTYNMQQLADLVDSDRQGRPLITVVNHESNIDDPLLSGALPWRVLWRTIRNGRMRYVPASEFICFPNDFFSFFFGLGRLVPVRWGLGVNQFGLQYTGDRMLEGGWINIFPEGFVNQLGFITRIKWGVAELAMRGAVASPALHPIILPIAHSGLDTVMPLSSKIKVPRIGKEIHIAVGEPFDLSSVMAYHQHCKSPAEVARSHAADIVQMKLCDLVHRLHHYRHTLKADNPR